MTADPAQDSYVVNWQLMNELVGSLARARVTRGRACAHVVPCVHGVVVRYFGIGGGGGGRYRDATKAAGNNGDTGAAATAIDRG